MLRIAAIVVNTIACCIAAVLLSQISFRAFMCGALWAVGAYFITTLIEVK